MATSFVTLTLAAISHIVYTSPIENIKIVNFGTGTSMYYAATLSNIANDHVLSHFEVRQSDLQWFTCSDVGYAQKCSVDTALELPLSIRLTANGETITGYNKVKDFTDAFVWDFGNNFQTGHIHIHNAGASTTWHYAAIVNGVTPGYIISEFSIKTGNDEWFVCDDLAFEFTCNVNTEIILPISVRLIANGDSRNTLTGYDLVTNFTDGLNFDLGNNYEAYDYTTTTTTTTTAAPVITQGVKGTQDKGALIAGFVITVIVSLVIGIAIGVFVYQRQQKRKGYSKENLQLKETDENKQKAEMMAQTIDVEDDGNEEETQNVNIADDVDEEEEDRNDADGDNENENIVQP